MARLLLILVLAVLPIAAGVPSAAQIESRPLGSQSSERSPLGSPSPASTSVGSTIASLAAVIAVIVACFTGYRVIASRAGGLAGQVASTGAPAGVLDLLGRYPIGRGQSLLLLKVDRRILLVAQSSPSRVGGAPAMSTLCEITDADEVSSVLGKTGKSESSFRDVIATLQRAESPPHGVPPADGIEVVDLTRSETPLAKLASLGRKRA
ncbi:MAG: flagellar biosynthetic protein FliO [Planctomycetota bacterium]